MLQTVLGIHQHQNSVMTKYGLGAAQSDRLRVVQGAVVQTVV